MASISKYLNKDGSYSYKVAIRKKNTDVYKTFLTLEDAELYVQYKERLLTNIENFEKPLVERITLSQIFDLKIESIPETNPKEKSDIENSKIKIMNLFDGDPIYYNIALDEMKNVLSELFKMDVYRGAAKEHNLRRISTKTVLKVFAHFSACVSFAQSKGIPLENHPNMLIKTIIRPLLEQEKAASK